MFTIGQLVIYGIHGVCRITGCEEKNLGKEKKQYYCLEPVEQPGAVFYIPAGNQTALAKMRPIMTRSEFEALITEQKNRPSAWVEDEALRKQRYRELIFGGDRAELIAMVSALYRYKRKVLESGRKFHVSDASFLHDATQLISAEVSAVLGISVSEVGEYMKQQLEAGE